MRMNFSLGVQSARDAADWRVLGACVGSAASLLRRFIRRR